MKAANPIRFGTDGWRGKVGQDFTEENVRRATGATAQVLRDREVSGPVVVGFDRRPSSAEFAHIVARTLVEHGREVILSRDFTPTPAVSVAVRDFGAAAGIVITASHNPAEWNGFKVKEGFGGSARLEVTREIETRIEGGHALPAASVARGKLTHADLIAPYEAKLRSIVDLETIAASKFRVVVDPIHGAGSGVLARLLRESGLHVTEIRGEASVNFGGVNPEPIAPNLGPLFAAMRAEGADIALALDGDADRVGALDERAEFFDSHRCYVSILDHLADHRKMRGAVGKTVSSSVMVERIAARHGINVRETPIGFKWIGELIVSGDVFMGGEESGGLGYAFHVPERDGTLSALLLLEACAQARVRPYGLLRERIFAYVGEWHYDRVDIHLTAAQKAAAVGRLAQVHPDAVAGYPIERVQRTDGVKLHLEGGRWLLLRMSGTEPLLRIYAEAQSPSEVQALLKWGVGMAEAE